MEFTKVKPYKDSQTLYFVSGIYKIVSYRANSFCAYYIPKTYNGWGDVVCKHPDLDRLSGIWKFSSYADALAACEEHATAFPDAATERTSARAAELLEHYQELERKWRKETPPS
jgi:hypothetical protein